MKNEKNRFWARKTVSSFIKRGAAVENTCCTLPSLLVCTVVGVIDRQAGTTFVVVHYHPDPDITSAHRLTKTFFVFCHRQKIPHTNYYNTNYYNN